MPSSLQLYSHNSICESFSNYERNSFNLCRNFKVVLSLFSFMESMQQVFRTCSRRVSYLLHSSGVDQGKYTSCFVEADCFLMWVTVEWLTELAVALKQTDTGNGNHELQERGGKIWGLQPMECYLSLLFFSCLLLTLEGRHYCLKRCYRELKILLSRYMQKERLLKKENVNRQVIYKLLKR